MGEGSRVGVITVNAKRARTIPDAFV